MSALIEQHSRSRAMRVRSAFLADWDDVTFVHYAVTPGLLQRQVPFELDLFAGEAYVSLVAFTQRNLRPRTGGRFAAALLLPLASHEFLNVRTYVRHAGQPGIHFLCEWIPNRLATWVGPPLYGLPYRLGKLTYRYDRDGGVCRHEVVSAGARLAFDAHPLDDTPPNAARPGTLDAFLLERYVAFTRRRGKKVCFQVEHVPWPQRRAIARMRDTGLLDGLGLPLDGARPVGGNYSEGVKQVGMGPPVVLDQSQLINIACEVFVRRV